MANNYLLFSFDLCSLTKEEKDWLTQELQGVDEGVFDSWSQEEKVAWSLEHGCDEPSEWPGFDQEPYGDDIIFYSEESGNLDGLSNLMQRYLKKFHPDECIGIEWACTCSKPRPGEFGGGAIFITAEKQENISSASWLQGKKSEWVKSHG